MSDIQLVVSNFQIFNQRIPRLHIEIPKNINTKRGDAASGQTTVIPAK